MPNWCWNSLCISGDEKVIKDMREATRSEDSEFSLESFHPMPPEEEVDENELSDFAQSLTAMPLWYRWRVSNWGTKWDVTDCVVTMETKEGISYEFSTAWAPPSEAIEKLSTLYPSLSFVLEYDEPGNDFWGIEEWQNGYLTNREDGPSRMFGVEEDLPDED